MYNTFADQHLYNGSVVLYSMHILKEFENNKFGHLNFDSDLYNMHNS